LAPLPVGNLEIGDVRLVRGLASRLALAEERHAEAAQGLLPVHLDGIAGLVLASLAFLGAALHDEPVAVPGPAAVVVVAPVLRMALRALALAVVAVVPRVVVRPQLLLDELEALLQHVGPARDAPGLRPAPVEPAELDA